MTLTALAVVLAAALALVSLREAMSPGPLRFTVVVQRYGATPVIVAFGLTVVVMLYLLHPSWRANLASIMLLAGPVAVAATIQRNLIARAVLRCRWPSVARSAGLARLDRRGESWPGDATTTVVGAVRIEWLPILSRGRRVPGVGVRYRVTPARGGTLDQLAEAAEALAAGLHVARVEVTRHRPDRGELLAVLR